MSAWQLVERVLRIAFMSFAVAFAIFGVFELLTIVAAAAERDEIDD